MKSSASRRTHRETGSMRGIKFYGLFFGTIALLWALVTVFGHS